MTSHQYPQFSPENSPKSAKTAKTASAVVRGLSGDSVVHQLGGFSVMHREIDLTVMVSRSGTATLTLTRPANPGIDAKFDTGEYMRVQLPYDDLIGLLEHLEYLSSEESEERQNEGEYED